MENLLNVFLCVLLMSQLGFFIMAWCRIYVIWADYIGNNSKLICTKRSKLLWLVITVYSLYEMIDE